MMKLIADSGSTKTMWTLTEDGVVKSTIRTNGLNPYFHTAASVEAIILADLAPFVPCDHIREIHFYGSGCSTEKNDRMISDSLRIYFRKAEIHVYHDILGAARALLGHGTGIAGILGTGCNSCYYDGDKCYQEVDSLGYLFGDEGAGSYLGKLWMAGYLKKEAPAELIREFNEVYRLSLEDILNALYNRPYPNRFLASFSEFLAPRQHHPFIRNLVTESFNAFVQAQLSYYGKFQPTIVSFTGSIAYYYQDILTEVMAHHNLSMGIILQNPLDGLVTFHG